MSRGLGVARASTLALAALTLAGCGGSDRAPGATTGSGCPECGAYGEILGGLCDLQARCPDDVNPIAYRTRAECIDILAFVLTCHLERDEVDDVDRYRLEQVVPTVDAARAGACVAWLRTADCSVLRGVSDGDSSASSSGGDGPANPCDGLLVASDEASAHGAAAGASCEREACAAGLVCEPSTPGPEPGSVTCAVCQPLPVAGEPCDQYRCAGGAWCDTGDGGAATPMCAAVLDVDEACGDGTQCASGFCHPELHACASGGFAGDPCAAAADCRDGGFCDAGACAPRRPNGAACDAPDACLAGVCEVGRCGAPDGASCSYDGVCAGRCDEGQGVCVSRLADGAGCETASDCTSDYCTYDGHVCAERCGGDEDCEGGYCDWQSQTCLPRRPDGSGCDDDDQCTSGVCGGNDTCGARPTLGGPCQSSDECYPLGYCQGGTCVQRKGPSQACDAPDACQEPFLCVRGQCRMMNLQCRPASVGSLCAWLRVCADGAYCDFFDGFTCKPKKALGAECMQSEQCAAGAFCALDADQAKMICRARGKAGSACRDGSECQDGLYCIPGSGADAGSATCGAGPAGRPCDAYDEAVPACPDGFYCTTRGQCAALGGQGDECGYYDPCVAGLFCDASEGCQPLRLKGEPCGTTQPCADAYNCGPDAVCVDDARLGEACQPYAPGPECAAGLGCEYVDGAYRCQAKLALGAHCYDDDQCASGVCHPTLGCVVSAQCSMP
ncbi:MAG: hypothetical protein U1F43_13280 [Myxococcota bacterium]